MADTKPVETKPAEKEKKPNKSYLMQVQDTYTRMIEAQFIENRLPMSQYAKECVINALSTIQTLFEKANINYGSPEVDQSSLTTVLRQVAALQLNSAVTPKEVYFVIRNENRGIKNGPDKWVKKIELGLEGDGNDRLLRTFGDNVKTIRAMWQVRAEDKFEYPKYKGVDVIPPEWEPTGKGKVVRVVYIVEKKDGQLDYLIQERADVRPNLIAHIANNLMNECFGMAKSRFDADMATKAKIDAEKKKILAMIRNMSMDQILEEPSIQGWINGPWVDGQSSESMIVRKMRNNAVKKYPKNFGSSLIADAYSETDEGYRNAQIEAEANATKEAIDITPPQVQADPAPAAQPVEKQVPLDEPGF